MKRYVKFLLLFLMVFGSQLFAQEAGKIYSKADADALLGKVTMSMQIDRDKLVKITDTDSKGFMFKINGGELIILDAQRKTLYPDSRMVSSSEVFNYFSKSKVKEFLNQTSASVISIQMRGSTLTLESDGFDLDNSFMCPPICP